MADSILSRSEFSPDLFCTDFGSCLAFYRDTLGLRVEEIPEMPGNAVVYAGHGTKLGLHSSDRASQSDHTAASFLTDDVDGAIGHLRTKGVKLEDYDIPPSYDFPGLKTVDGVATMGPYRAAWFKDPGGNILCVSPSLEALRKAA
jgi:catechol 2,3-dioxygenase-like lactoylglutathione lyase family enzyme